jgi:hypothetical protein
MGGEGQRRGVREEDDFFFILHFTFSIGVDEKCKMKNEKLRKGKTLTVTAHAGGSGVAPGGGFPLPART